MKKMWKKFWTLSNRQSGGFTLVELIVVIAILAILAGVGVPVYSGYVKKANIAADEQLFAEIERAVHLAYYSDTDEFVGGYILLSPTENAEASSADLENAMKSAFGDNWATTAKVLCTDWTSAAYVNSSFHGQETALLGVVEDLTETLEVLIGNNNSLVGDKFTSFLGELEIDTDDKGAVADAAVLYVANDSAAMTNDPVKRQAAINAMATILNAPNGDAVGHLYPHFNNSVVAASAAYYAMIEGYCRYAAGKGNSAPLNALSGAGFGDNPGDAKDAVNTKVNAVMAVIMENGSFKAGTYVEEYFAVGGQAEKDAEAYLDVMTTVNSAQDDVLESGKNLGDDNFFGDNANLTDMFQQVANGGTFVFAREVNGELIIKLPSRD